MMRRETAFGLIVPLLAIAIGLLAVEIALRAADFEASAIDLRSLFITPHSFRNVADNVPAYWPQATVRQVAVYPATAADELSIEYDVTFETNNQGHVQHKATFCGRTTIAIIGDSFTEGQGARPWFYDLENEIALPNGQLVNFGLMGTGVSGWRSMLDHYAHCYNITKLVVIFIGDDWYRPIWEFSAGQLACLSGEQACHDSTALYYRMQLSDPASDVLAAARLRNIERHAQSGPSHSGLRSIDLISTGAERLFDMFITQKRERRFEEAQASFVAMMSRFEKDSYRLIHVTMKDEAAGHPLREDSERALAWLNGKDFEVSSCPLDESDFHDRDGHPNEAGYVKIRQCAERAITAIADHPVASQAGTATAR